MVSFKRVVDKNGTQCSLIPLVECKEAFEYTIPSFSSFLLLWMFGEFVAGFFSKTVMLQ